MIRQICSGIPHARIVDYFDRWSIKESAFIKKEWDHASGSMFYRFDAYTIMITANPNPPVIRPVVPMTDITFDGDADHVDVALQAYRMAFLSAGG